MDPQGADVRRRGREYDLSFQKCRLKRRMPVELCLVRTSDVDEPFCIAAKETGPQRRPGVPGRRRFADQQLERGIVAPMLSIEPARRPPDVIAVALGP